MGKPVTRNSSQIDWKIYVERINKHRVRSSWAFVLIFINLFMVKVMLTSCKPVNKQCNMLCSSLPPSKERLYTFDTSFFLTFFIVVQVQFSAFPPTPPHRPSPSHLPPRVPLPLVSVHVSFTFDT